MVLLETFVWCSETFGLGHQLVTNSGQQPNVDTQSLYFNEYNVIALEQRKELRGSAEVVHCSITPYRARLEGNNEDDELLSNSMTFDQAWQRFNIERN